MGWTDFIDETVADGLGSISAGLGELGEQATDALGAPDWVGNTLDFLGEDGEFALNAVGNFTTPVLDVVDTGMQTVFDDIGSLGENFEQFADDPSWDNFLDQGSDLLDDVQDNGWDAFTDTTQSFADAWDESAVDLHSFIDDANEIWGTDGNFDVSDWQFGDVTDWLDDNREWIEPFTSPALTAPWLAYQQWQEGDGWFGGTPWSDAAGTIIGGDGGGLGGLFGGGGLGGLLGGLFGGGGGAGGSSGGPVEQGMNRAEAADVLESLRGDRESLQGLIEDASQAVAQLAEHWEGPDAARYQQEWGGKRQALHQAVLMLEAMARQLQQQVGQQQSTSQA